MAFIGNDKIRLPVLIANDLKDGIIYISGNNPVINVSGSGIYTTTNLERTSSYIGDSGEVLTLTLKNNAKIIVNAGVLTVCR